MFKNIKNFLKVIRKRLSLKSWVSTSTMPVYFSSLGLKVVFCFLHIFVVCLYIKSCEHDARYSDQISIVVHIAAFLNAFYNWYKNKSRVNMDVDNCVTVTLRPSLTCVDNLLTTLQYRWHEMKPSFSQIFQISLTSCVAEINAKTKNTRAPRPAMDTH